GFGLVARQVEVAAIVDALELLPAEREAVLHVDRLLGVVRELVGGVLAEAKAGLGDAIARVPAPAPREPVLEGRCGVVGLDEVLHLHLLELAHPEDKVARADLVAEALADLGDTERDLLPAPLLDLLHSAVAP